MANSVGEQVGRPNVAVIAVHGIGDQKPLETIRAIGDLLQELDTGEAHRIEPASCQPSRSVTPQYEAFTARPVRLNVRPVVVSSSQGDSAGKPSVHGPFHAWVNSLLREGSPRIRESDVATTFMRGQLRRSRGNEPDETYDTVRLEGTRVDGSGPAKTVHVYELYWADLSRLKAGILTIFAELFQLLFHVPSLGRHAVDAEATQHPTLPWWRHFREVQGWPAFVLTVFIAVLQLIMLGIIGVAVALKGLYTLGPRWQTAITFGVAAAVLAVLLGLWLWRQAKLRLLPWLLPILSWPAALAVIFRYRDHVPVAATHVLALSMLAIAARWLINGALDIYEERRPGVRRMGIATGCVVLVVGTLVIPFKRPSDALYSQLLFGLARIFEVFTGALTLAWLVFAIGSVLAFCVGAIAVRSIDDPRNRASARRTNWTARLTLSIPATALLIVALFGWGVLAIAVKPILGDVTYAPLFPPLDPGINTVGKLIDGFLENGPYVVLPVLLIASALAALPALWGFAPVALAEVFPPPLHDAGKRQYAQRLGQWLTLAFGGLKLSGALLYGVVIFIFPVWHITVLIVNSRNPNFLILPLTVRSDIQAIGGATGLLFAWLFSIRGSLKKATLGFRPALDLVLDVDSWLREHPLTGNPRARICARYASLLRYVCRWTDPMTGFGYRAIIIVAHSQGTIITADLLRFLALEPDAELARLGDDHTLPVYLFTMGCPLRQLYGRRFPRLYGWATREDATPMGMWQADDLVNPTRPVAAPDPADLRVNKWVNAYRSGDYVGRYLWRTDTCAYLWDGDVMGETPYNSTDTGSRLEFCIGGGAHTHYWDKTARPIAWALDRLIADA